MQGEHPVTSSPSRGRTAVQDRPSDTPIATGEAHILNRYQIHPAADLFPMMSHEALQQMADDIALSGLREPVWMYEGKVLDGRNRLVACDLAGVEPTFRQWQPRNPSDSPTRFVWSINGPRRHLSTSQRAAIAVRMAEQIRAEHGRIRDQVRADRAAGIQPTLFSDAASTINQPVGIARTPGTRLAFTNTAGSQDPPRPVRTQPDTDQATATGRVELGKSREQAAAELRVSPAYVSYAQNVRAADPEAFAAIERGELTLSQAQAKVVKDAQAAGRLADLPLAPSVVKRVLESADRNYGKGSRQSKERIRVQKFGTVSTTKTTVQVTMTAGNAEVIEEWLNRMQDDPRILDLNHEIISGKPTRSPSRR